MYRFYYNHSTGGDVLYCIINPSSYPDRSRKEGDVVALYHGEERIGINFLNISKTMKIKANGMIPAVNEAMLEVINHMLVNAGEAPLPPCPSSGHLIAEVASLEEHPLDEKKRIVHLRAGDKNLDTVTRYSNVGVSSRVVVALDHCLKADGTEFLAHSERNIPIDCEICSEKDLRLGEENKLAFLPEGNPGDDFFTR